MKKQKEENVFYTWVFIFVIVFCGVFGAALHVLFDAKINAQAEVNRVTCNRAFNNKDKLETKIGLSVWLDNKKEVSRDDIDFVLYELNKTNEQYNRLEKLFACYFDKP